MGRLPIQSGEKRICWVSSGGHQHRASQKQAETQGTGYIIQDIEQVKAKQNNRWTPTRDCRFQIRSSRTVTVVRLPTGERREVDTGSAESAFERCSVDPRRKGRSQLEGEA